MSYEYRAQMMNGTIKDAKDNYENAQGNAEKERYEIEIQRLQSLQNAYKTAGEYEAKAKAFDEIREARKEVLSDVRERGLKLPTDLDKFSMMTERIINKYESGESDV